MNVTEDGLSSLNASESLVKNNNQIENKHLSNISGSKGKFAKYK